MDRSAAKRVLATYELLGAIIELAPSKAQVTAVQVCHSWSHHATPHIWKDLPSLRHLLNILVINKASTKQIAWDRFKSYGSHVRSLVHDEEDLNEHQFAEELYSSIKPVDTDPEPFLPKLRKLKWTTSHFPRKINMSHFILPTIEDFTFDIFSERHIPSLFNTLQGRLPNVRKLSICFYTSTIQPNDSFLAALLGDMPKLSEVALPPFFLTDKLVNALLTLPKLEKLLDSRVQAPPRKNVEQGCKLCLEDERLSGLQALAFRMDLQKASQGFKSIHYAPRSLQRLDIGSPFFTAPSLVFSFLQTVVSTNPSITEFGLHLTSLMGINDPARVITFQHVSPLLKLNLTSLKILHDYPLQYSYDDVRTMGTAWSGMVKLDLGWIPWTFIRHPRGFPLSSFKAFAIHFPNLRTLRVYLTIDKVDCYCHADCLHEDGESKRFTQLRELVVGDTILYPENSGSVVLMLTSLVPLEQTCELRGSPMWNRAIQYFQKVCEAQSRVWMETQKVKNRIVQLEDVPASIEEKVAMIEEILTEYSEHVAGPVRKAVLAMRDRLA
ncbi:hypothetical protein FRC03_003550 [Tulasnella sp. 419]|nr:hypothetical protein FRC03_003550 [Tulasnella sp. 419]